MVKPQTQKLHDEVINLGVNLPSHISRDEIAVLILPGGGLGVPPTRFTEVPWEDFSDDVWVAGTRGDPAYTREEIVGHIARDGQLPARLATQLFALHTPEQMEWGTKQMRRHPLIRHLIISTASYHLVRGVLTFVRTWIKEGNVRNPSIGVIPTSDPNEDVLAIPSKTSRTLEEELARIELYQEKGDVATEDEYTRFMKNVT